MTARSRRRCAVAGQPDPKNGKRIVNPALLRDLHQRWTGCPLCALQVGAWKNDGGGQLSLHHVLPKGSPYFGDDVEGNLVMLCGSGTTGHHGLVEGGDVPTLLLLGYHVRRRRLDVVRYVREKLAYNGPDAGDDWLQRHLGIGSAA